MIFPRNFEGTFNILRGVELIYIQESEGDLKSFSIRAIIEFSNTSSIDSELIHTQKETYFHTNRIPFPKRRLEYTFWPYQTCIQLHDKSGT